MARLFEHYYLQRNAGDAWETVQQSDSVAVLTDGLAEQLTASDRAEIRIVGASFDDGADRWAYEQLFYIDQSSIDLGIAEHDGGWNEAGEAPAPVSAPTPMAVPTPAPEPGREPGPAIAALREEQQTLAPSAGPPAPEPSPPPADPLPWSIDEPDDQSDDEGRSNGDDLAADPEDLPPWHATDSDAESGDDNTAPWLAGGDGFDDADKDTAEPFRFGTPKRRRFPVGKIILVLLIAGFLLLVAGLGSMVYLQHPLLLKHADQLGIGSYIRWGGQKDAMTVPVPAPSAAAPQVEQVEPLTTGQVVRFAGVAPALHGKWSPRKCDTTFIEFFEDGYHRTVNGQSSAALAAVSETLQDEFQFYLRRSPTVVEHYRRVTPNDIQLAGATTESGFLESSTKAEIYSRCK